MGMIFIYNTFLVLQIFATVHMIILICASLCPIHQREPGNVMEGKNQTALSEFIILGFSDLNELQFLLFTIFFLTYVCTLGGNVFIILVSVLDPRLHTPMYYFLGNLAFLDICYTTTNVPQMMVHLLSERKSISYGRCMAQLFAFIFFVGSECLLLAAMAYDRYIAICKPLRYSVIMNRVLYSRLAASCWTGGFLNSVVHTVLTFRLPFCGNNEINYFFCDIPPLLILSCGDTSVNELALLSIGVFIGWTPFLCIILSYLYIISTILRIRSSEGRQKAFSTCASPPDHCPSLLWQLHLHICTTHISVFTGEGQTDHFGGVEVGGAG